jgi:crotonobetainyl-CoA:carnitine CoA-transferase CaiB-like acyl-CoA transferase
MYEVAHKVLGGTMVEYFRDGHVRSRTGNRGAGEPLGGTFRCADGWIVIAPIDEPGRNAAIGTPAAGTQPAAALEAWLAARDCQEAVRVLSDGGIACSKVMSAKDMAEDPYYQARGVDIQWEDPELGPVRGVGIVPRFSATPGKIWRGAATVGKDNQMVYQKLLGLSDEEIETLTGDGII